MIKEVTFGILATILMIGLLVASIFYVPSPRTRVYDCGMAEWHPDIPNKVKEECRKLRSNANI